MIYLPLPVDLEGYFISQPLTSVHSPLGASPAWEEIAFKEERQRKGERWEAAGYQGRCHASLDPLCWEGSHPSTPPLWLPLETLVHCLVMVLTKLPTVLPKVIGVQKAQSLCGIGQPALGEDWGAGHRIFGDIG